ncbi:CaiB/BaiF CoA transferase family protein [Shumkonia mesophila]|uniref:CaiB/BaiF CoA transferase family protein n=1 Tax=Shumkonia mesophila TaxID=2838854 RepID=UPI002934F195|nr:CaiB/BaiF CoA-transferase family protein [Shumkonia mesophila]
MSRPFKGIRILDFTRVISGPFATQLLATLGADVIKIEKPGTGDEARHFCCNPDLLAHGMASGFLSVNAGKRSVTLNLKSAEVRDLVRTMARSADVVVENFRPGVMDRLGLGYDDLKAVKPDIVYCAISGFGQTGPASGVAGYDGAVQALSGMMSITGHPQCGPTRVGAPVIDMCSGYVAALAIASALFRRACTGQGQFIDVAMLDVNLSTMRSAIAWWQAGGDPVLRGNQAWTRIPTSDSFHASDGQFMLTVNNDEQLRILLRTVQREDALDDPRFKDWPSRIENGLALRAILEERFATDTAHNWEQRLTDAGLAVAGIRTLPEAMEHPQLPYRNLLLKMDGAKGVDGPITLLNTPFMCMEDGPAIDRPPPGLGEHTAEVLAEFGVSATENPLSRHESKKKPARAV